MDILCIRAISRVDQVSRAFGDRTAKGGIFEQVKETVEQRRIEEERVGETVRLWE